MYPPDKTGKNKAILQGMISRRLACIMLLYSFWNVANFAWNSS